MYQYIYTYTHKYICISWQATFKQTNIFTVYMKTMLHIWPEKLLLIKIRLPVKICCTPFCMASKYRGAAQTGEIKMLAYVSRQKLDKPLQSINHILFE